MARRGRLPESTLPSTTGSWSSARYCLPPVRFWKPDSQAPGRGCAAPAPSWPALYRLQVCNHPLLTYPPYYGDNPPEDVVRTCGKMVSMDRMLVKLFHTPHRVLLFSTMTKLLDLMENYLRWRQVWKGLCIASLHMTGALRGAAGQLPDKKVAITLCYYRTQVDTPRGKRFMKYSRIDGSTTLEDREAAIQVWPAGC